VRADSIAPELDAALEAAAAADPGNRIEYRDAIAAFGGAAVEAMTEWLGDPRLAAFAIRVLERIGRDPKQRAPVVDSLAAVDRQELPIHLASDLDHALDALGKADGHRARTGGSRSARPAGLLGVPGRNYWVMRTSPWERPYIWAEAQRGRLRQGWGWTEEMNLDVIAEVASRGAALTEEQQLAWRSRRMRTTASDGMRVGDLVVTPNLPEWGRLSLFRVTGSYRYVLDTPRRFDERFGHILPVELVAAAIDRRSPVVSDGLRAMLRPQTRLYNISGYGGDVERLLGDFEATDRAGALWTDDDYATLFRLYPADGDRPTPDEVERIAADLRRSPDAIVWQWEDGASYVSGRSAMTTSDALKNWLDRNQRHDPSIPEVGPTR
jgi:hypothetical protein